MCGCSIAACRFLIRLYDVIKDVEAWARHFTLVKHDVLISASW